MRVEGVDRLARAIVRGKEALHNLRQVRPPGGESQVDGRIAIPVLHVGSKRGHRVGRLLVLRNLQHLVVVARVGRLRLDAELVGLKVLGDAVGHREGVTRPREHGHEGFASRLRRGRCLGGSR